MAFPTVESYDKVGMMLHKDIKVEPFIRALAAEWHSGLSSSMWPLCGRVLEDKC